MDSQSISDLSQRPNPLSETFFSVTLTDLEMSGQSLQTIENCACRKCKSAMWQFLTRKHLRCYCTRMFQIIYDSQNKSQMVELCDGMTLSLIPEDDSLTAEVLPEELTPAEDPAERVPEEAAPAEAEIREELQEEQDFAEEEFSQEFTEEVIE